MRQACKNLLENEREDGDKIRRHRLVANPTAPYPMVQAVHLSRLADFVDSIISSVRGLCCLILKAGVDLVL